MRVVTKKVYYCDYCNKHGLRPLTIHEARCTANPDRECHWKAAGSSWRSFDKPHVAAGELRPTIRWCRRLKSWNETNFDKLRERCDGCPACMLAVMRQARPKTFPWSDKGDLLWDFEKEKARFNEELQQDMLEDERREIEASWL